MKRLKILMTFIMFLFFATAISQIKKQPPPPPPPPPEIQVEKPAKPEQISRPQFNHPPKPPKPPVPPPPPPPRDY